jgi:hypothetical protein
MAARLGKLAAMAQVYVQRIFVSADRTVMRVWFVGHPVNLADIDRVSFLF